MFVQAVCRVFIMMAYYTLELVLALKENQNPLLNSISTAMNNLFSKKILPAIFIIDLQN